MNGPYITARRSPGPGRLQWSVRGTHTISGFLGNKNTRGLVERYIAELEGPAD